MKPVLTRIQEKLLNSEDFPMPNVNTPCWLWHKTDPQIHVGKNPRTGGQLMAHPARVLYAHLHGLQTLPRVRKICTSPGCVNPLHYTSPDHSPTPAITYDQIDPQDYWTPEDFSAAMGTIVTQDMVDAYWRRKFQNE